MIQVDLGKAPSERWAALGDEVLTRQAQALVDRYVDDLGGMDAFAPLIDEYRQGFVAPEYWDEVESIANLIGRSPEEALVANLYYDAFRAFVGCTAFALDTPKGPLHARNLDWEMANELATCTLIIECSGGTCPSPYKLVSWPGFIGAFSGVAHERFAITLNAVISSESPPLAEPTTLLLRKVFDTAPDFKTAVSMLSETSIAADCLLLVTGVNQGEMVVIERTGTRSALRHPEDGFIAVTNEYKVLEARGGERR